MNKYIITEYYGTYYLRNMDTKKEVAQIFDKGEGQLILDVLNNYFNESVNKETDRDFHHD